ncbi:hypothetical protein [Mesorhizobium sp. L-8-3]|uniref:hypothetical protein n=1 Tax=Mesorhizobium sp. L-8-3 TaxID=2744522 RepID=UPI001927889D|nr:hypothetical protein [Mesorhizobium sp. L-8-3]BCH22449.1 hypothetical protein MesoLjLb_22340 [Mesorhizobium sp. L-8-3]
MKARSQAQKRAARRGRPTKNVPFREPNGRSSRAEEPIDKLAMAMRAKMLGVSEERARDPRAGSFLGYLAMLGRSDGLSGTQHEAALRFKELRDEYLKAIKAPNAVVDNQSSGRPSDVVTDDYIRWCANATARYAAARRAIQEAQDSTRSENLWAALDLVVVQEQPIFNLIGATRTLCNALALHFKR